jgi:hypothetical protein
MPVIALSSASQLPLELPAVLTPITEAEAPIKRTASLTKREQRLAMDRGLARSPVTPPHRELEMDMDLDLDMDAVQSGQERRDETSLDTPRPRTPPNDQLQHQHGHHSPSQPQHQHQHRSDSDSHASSSRIIPPPPTPRRHKSGILMSRVRANSAGVPLRTLSMTASKSFGDLSDSSLTMGGMPVAAEEDDEFDDSGPSRAITRDRGRDGKRVASEGALDQHEHEHGHEGSMWDNR